MKFRYFFRFEVGYLGNRWYDFDDFFFENCSKFSLFILTQYPPLSFYKDAEFRGSWEGQYSYETNFWCFIWTAKTIPFHLIYRFLLKKLKFNAKIKILFEKARTKKGISQKWREMTWTTFVKNALTPKLFGIFEFCKKLYIRNFSWRPVVKFYQMRLKSNFLKKYFHFLVKWGSF